MMLQYRPLHSIRLIHPSRFLVPVPVQKFPLVREQNVSFTLYRPVLEKRKQRSLLVLPVQPEESIAQALSSVRSRCWRDAAECANNRRRAHNVSIDVH
jgi:hypothetical protein